MKLFDDARAPAAHGWSGSCARTAPVSVRSLARCLLSSARENSRGTQTLQESNCRTEKTTYGVLISTVTNKTRRQYN